MSTTITINLRQCLSVVVSFAALVTLTAVPGHAQYGGPPTTYPGPPQFGYNPQVGNNFPGNNLPGGAYPGYPTQGGNPYQPGFPQQAGNGQRGYPGTGQGRNRQTLPDGIDQLYALQSINTLVLFGTKEGYETALEVARNIDGDLDIVRTQITLVKATRADLSALGVTLTDDPPTGADLTKLVTARQQGALRATDAVRITTRENTVVDALLGAHQSEVPLSVVPRVTKDGRIAIELTEPVDITVAASSRDTAIVVLPGSGKEATATVSLLFITPTILPSDYRPAK